MTSETQRHKSALPPAGDVGEPIAWKFRWKINGEYVNWRYSVESHKNCSLDGYEEVQLYSSDALTTLSARLAHMTECFDRSSSLRAADARLIIDLQARLAEAEREIANTEELQRDAARECEQYSNEIADHRARVGRAEAALQRVERFANMKLSMIVDKRQRQMLETFVALARGDMPDWIKDAETAALTDAPAPVQTQDWIARSINDGLDAIAKLSPNCRATFSNEVNAAVDARTKPAPVQGDGEAGWRHKKRGTTYDVIGEAELQTSEPIEEGTMIVVYRCRETGTLWARPWAEFCDGRFERIAASPKTEGSDNAE